jgi:hypothetical protein
MKEEIALLKRELNTVKETISSYKNFTMEKLQIVDEENSKLRQELRNLKEASIQNTQDIPTFNDMNETVNLFRLQLQTINESLQNHDVQLINISSQFPPGKHMFTLLEQSASIIEL